MAQGYSPSSKPNSSHRLSAFLFFKGSGYQRPMALKILMVAGGLILFGSMIWDRFRGTRYARWVLGTLVAVMASVMVISAVVSSL